MKTTCFIIATKDRPDDLRRLLASIAIQSHRPEMLIIVDSSKTPVDSLVDEFRSDLRLDYLGRQPPSAAGQRNAGVGITPEGVELIGFLDDDATLKADALEKMLQFWEGAPPDLGGAAFNLVNHPAQAFASIKRSWPLKALGLYSGELGRVTPSGWQTLTGCVARHTWVDWLSTGAVVWRSEILRAHRFDEFFSGYSYLEDLDFSYGMRRQWRLAIVANACYRHYPSPIRHFRQFDFGKTEIRNRLYFVRKHSLSSSRCWFGLTLRMAITVGEALGKRSSGPLLRAFGNMAGMIDQARSGWRRAPSAT